MRNPRWRWFWNGCVLLLPAMLCFSAAHVMAQDSLCREAQQRWKNSRNYLIRGLDKLYECVDSGNVHEDCYYELERVMNIYQTVESNREETETMCADRDIEHPRESGSPTEVDPNRLDETNVNTGQATDEFNRVDTDPESLYGDSPIDFSDLQPPQ